MFRGPILCLLAIAAPCLLAHSAELAGEDEKIIGVWERVSEKDGLEETWVIKKNKDKWSVSGSFWKRGKNGEVGNFKGKDVKFKDGTLTFTQDYFKVPQGRKNGVKITASAEGDRLDFTAKQGKVETNDTMERGGDASEVVGTWATKTLGMRESWIIEKDKKGALIVRGTFTKGGNEVGSFKGFNVRYFKHILWFNQAFTKIPSPAIRNGSAIACAGSGRELTYIWYNGKQQGKAKLVKQAK